MSDAIRTHVEALGGRSRIQSVAAIRATGKVMAGDKQVGFTMVAARPDRIRVETEKGDRILVQASDGKNPPWELDTSEEPPRYREMQPAAAKTFTADAEYDDPLVAGAARGYTIEYGGEVPSGGKKLIRLLVTRRLTETYSLLLDPDTYFIVKRIEDRKNAFGRPMRVETTFDDYRPVGGVLMPYTIILTIDGQQAQRTKIERIEANPQITETTFSHPLMTSAK